MTNEQNQISLEEHLAWCKTRAGEYLDRGDVSNAYASFTSDMTKHNETRNHPAMSLGVMLMLSGNLSSVEQMRNFIEGFN